MERAIVGFVQDDVGDWVALLDCLHRQHVRHQPPFRPAPWVVDDEQRAQRVGTRLNCPLCDRAELPNGLHVVRTTDTWDEHTLPAGLRRGHRVAAGRWGRLHVVDGQLRLVAQTSPVIDRVMDAGEAQPIPPDVVHEVEPMGALRCFVEFLAPPS